MDRDGEPIIASARNSLIRRARSLARRDVRQAEDAIVIEGLRAVIEAVRVGLALQVVLWSPERLHSDLARRAIHEAGERGARAVRVAPAVLDGLTERDASQGIVAIAQRPHAAVEDIPTASAPFVLALHEPQDPGNIGTIARTADAAGAAALVTLGEQGADPFDPKAIRASMGSIFALPVIELKRAGHALDALRQRGLRLVGTSGAGAVDLWQAPLAEPVVVLLGNERSGLPENVLAACDVAARIPLLGHADSLNVAAAAAVFAFEIVRQRRNL
jgi:tRNA G18 (ribose-2'-O)-methylase SpoU